MSSSTVATSLPDGKCYRINMEDEELSIRAHVHAGCLDGLRIVSSADGILIERGHLECFESLNP